MGQLLMNEPVLNSRTPSLAQVSKMFSFICSVTDPSPFFFSLSSPVISDSSYFFQDPKSYKFIIPFPLEIFNSQFVQ